MSEPESTRRRVHQRYPVELPVVVTSRDASVEGTTENVSLGGAFIVGPPLAFGAEVRLRFRPPALQQDMEIAGTVRWITASGMGIQFGSLRAREVWALNQLFSTVAPLP